MTCRKRSQSPGVHGRGCCGGSDEGVAFPAMAGGYTLLSSSPDIQILGPTESVNVYRYTAQALPSGVVFHTSIDPDSWNTSFVTAYLGDLAGQFNQRADDPRVVVISTSEQINPANQLVDLFTATLQSSSGKSTADLTDAYVALQDPFWNQLVDPIVAQLDAIEAAAEATVAGA